MYVVQGDIYCIKAVFFFSTVNTIFLSFSEINRMTFYQIAGDQPGTSIYINPQHVVRVVPNGQNSKIHLSDKTVYDVAQSPAIVSANLLKCLGGDN